MAVINSLSMMSANSVDAGQLRWYKALNAISIYVLLLLHTPAVMTLLWLFHNSSRVMELTYVSKGFVPAGVVFSNFVINNTLGVIAVFMCTRLSMRRSHVLNKMLFLIPALAASDCLDLVGSFAKIGSSKALYRDGMFAFLIIYALVYSLMFAFYKNTRVRQLLFIN